MEKIIKVERYKNLACNEKPFAFKFDYISETNDIHTWELVSDDREYRGGGFVELNSVLNSLSKDYIHFIYVKNIRVFEWIAENYYKYKNAFASLKDGRTVYNFTIDNIEFRNWDMFFSKEDDCRGFLEKLNYSRRTFKCSEYFESLSNHYNYTLATEMWKSIKHDCKLYRGGTSDYCKRMLPQTKREFELYMNANKGGYAFINPKYKEKKIKNVYSFDSSSSHIGLMARKKFPSYTFTYTNDYNKIKDIITDNDDIYSWIGSFEFTNLRIRNKRKSLLSNKDLYNYRPKFSLDTTESQIVVFPKDVAIYTLTEVDWEWFKQVFIFDSVNIIDFHYSKKKYLPTNILNMINDLYYAKQSSKKGSIERDLNKFRAELPYGQSIKNPFNGYTLKYDTDKGFVKELNDYNLEDIQKSILNHKLPYQLGIWTVAYSRAELIKLTLKMDNRYIVYGDTDSIKFLGKKNIKIIEEYNKEIDKEFEEVKEYTYIRFPKTLGRWSKDGYYQNFKAIETKWYLYIDENDKLDFKAAGADSKVLSSYLKNDNVNAFKKFTKGINCEGLFKTSKFKDNLTVKIMDNNNFYGFRLYSLEEFNKIYGI